MDHQQWLEQHDRMMADHEQFLKEHDQFIREHDQFIKEHEQAINRIDARLNRALRDSVREARNERARRKRALAEIDDKITQLAAAQLVTEEKLQRLIDERRLGGNGNR
jgi:chromosome segregation ATPase